MTDVIQGFSVPEAQRLTGLTFRRLQYWDQTGFISPDLAPRSGRKPRL
jgi:DNA-binding transcriptional MerR regulator